MGDSVVTGQTHERATVGVMGDSEYDMGVYGTSQQRQGVVGISKEHAGVEGNSTNGPGVVGISESDDAGVVAVNKGEGAGLYAKGGPKSAWAGRFDGSIEVTGRIKVEGKYLDEQYLPRFELDNLYDALRRAGVKV